MTTIRTGKFQQTQYNGYYEEIDEDNLFNIKEIEVLWHDDIVFNKRFAADIFDMVLSANNGIYNKLAEYNSKPVLDFLLSNKSCIFVSSNKKYLELFNLINENIRKLSNCKVENFNYIELPENLISSKVNELFKKNNNSLVIIDTFFPISKDNYDDTIDDLPSRYKKSSIVSTPTITESQGLINENRLLRMRLAKYES